MGVTKVFCGVYNTNGSGNETELSQASQLGSNLAQRERGGKRKKTNSSTSTDHTH